MKIYFYPNNGEQTSIFETTGDLIPDVGDKVIIEASCYTIAKKVFYYNQAFSCCMLFVEKVNDIFEFGKIKI